MGSKTLPSACYILSDESSIPFYSTSNGYNKKQGYSRRFELSATRYSFFKFHIKILLERTKLPTSAPRHLADGSGTSDHVNACLTDLLILMWFSELRCYAGMDQWNPFQKHIYKFGFLVPVTYLTTNTIYLLLYE